MPLPRIVVVILVCALIAVVVNALLPLPHPWGWLLHLALVVWVLIEVVRLAGYTIPRG